MRWLKSKEKALQRDLAREHLVEGLHSSGDPHAFIEANSKLEASQRFNDKELATHIKTRIEHEFLGSGDAGKLDTTNKSLPTKLQFTKKEIAVLLQARQQMFDASQEIEGIRQRYIQSGDSAEIYAFNAQHKKFQLLSGEKVGLAIHMDQIKEWDSLRSLAPSPEWAGKRASKEVVVQFELPSNPTKLMQALRSEFMNEQYQVEKSSDNFGEDQYKITGDNLQITITKEPWEKELTVHVDVEAKVSEKKQARIITKLANFATAAFKGSAQEAKVEITRDDTQQLGKKLDQTFRAASEKIEPLPRASRG